MSRVEAFDRGAGVKKVSRAREKKTTVKRKRVSSLDPLRVAVWACFTIFLVLAWVGIAWSIAALA